MMDIKNYPGGFDVWDSLGDWEAATGIKPAAKENCKKSLAL